jgi:hypothetical protein
MLWMCCVLAWQHLLLQSEWSTLEHETCSDCCESVGTICITTRLSQGMLQHVNCAYNIRSAGLTDLNSRRNCGLTRCQLLHTWSHWVLLLCILWTDLPDEDFVDRLMFHSTCGTHAAVINNCRTAHRPKWVFFHATRLGCLLIDLNDENILTELTLWEQCVVVQHHYYSS